MPAPSDALGVDRADELVGIDTLVEQLRDGGAGATVRLSAWLATHDSEALRDRALTAIKNESERLLVVDAAAAESLAALLSTGADYVDMPRFRALSAMAMGDVRRAQARYAEAVGLYEAGGRACLQLGDRVGWARSRIGWVVASQYSGQGREALPIAEQAYAVLTASGEHLRAGGISNNIAAVHYHLGAFAESLAVYDRAITHFEQARATIGSMADERIAKAIANKALALTMLGRFDQAIGLCEEARTKFVEHGESVSALRVDHFRASIHVARGQYTVALRIQAEALAAFEHAGLDEAGLQVAREMIACHAALNHPEEAAFLAEELVRRCERAGAPIEAARARLRCAQALVALGDFHAALSHLEVAGHQFTRAGLGGELGAVTLLHARMSEQKQDWAGALALADQAHVLFDERGLVEQRTHAELIRARASLALGDSTRAEALARGALETGTRLGMLPLSQAAHHALATVAVTNCKPQLALAEYEAAICDLEQVQRSLTTELRTEFLGDKLHLFQDAIELCLETGQLERGFGYLERAKSRALVDYLGSQPQVRVRAGTRAEGELIEELNQLREQHAWFYDRWQHEPGMSGGEIEILQNAVADRERQILKVHERLALLRDTERLEPLGPRLSLTPPTLPHVPEDTVLLEYAFWKDRGAVFIVSSRGINVEPIAAGTYALQRLINRWNLNLEGTRRAFYSGRSIDPLARNAVAQLENLYRVLLDPVAKYLAGVKRLIVVPYGPAHAVPFHALYDGQQYLTERFEIWTTPSTGLLTLCETRTPPSRLGNGALVVGYSGGALPSVVHEARRVASITGGSCFLEDLATREVVLTNAAQHPILHLAAHGESRLDNPAFAHIALADGQLTMADVIGLRLDGALVTLSACETGRAAVVGGDELVGLSRGFLFAGASTLVHSLWRVDDAATASLMESFYTHLRAGATPSAALRTAQRAMIEQGAAAFVWAPFQVAGYGGGEHFSAAPSSKEK